MAWKKGRPRYQLWKQERALDQARDYLAERDPANAKLAVDVALEAVPNNPNAWRVAAELLEQVGSPEAVRLRRRLAAMLPNSADDQANLVLTALRFRDVNAAKDAMQAMQPEVAAEVPALRAALAYALATRDNAMADLIMGELQEQVPDEVELQISRAMLWLRHPDPQRVNQAREELQAIAEREPERALPIYRAFGAFELGRRDFGAAKQWYERVAALPAADFNDQLQLANVEIAEWGQVSAERREALVGAAAVDPRAAAQYVDWLLVQSEAQQAQTWLATLAEELQRDPLVLAARAQVAARLGEWETLGELLLAGAWGPIRAQTVQLALSAKVVGESGGAAMRRDIWQLALHSAETQLSALVALQRLAAAAGWAEELEAALWEVVARFPVQTWAHTSLLASYRRAGDIDGIGRVMSALRDSDRGVKRYQHDWALAALLQNPTAMWNAPKETMRELYEAETQNANYAAGYAFALAQAGRGEEAVAVFARIPAAERDYGPRLPYAAYIYGVARDRGELARIRALADGNPAADYLPEEKRLFGWAEEALRRPAKKSPSAKEEAAAAVDRPSVESAETPAS